MDKVHSEGKLQAHLLSYQTNFARFIPCHIKDLPFCDLNNLISTVLWFQNGLLHLSGIVTKFVAECGYMIVKLIETGLDVTVDAAYVREPDDTLTLEIAYQLYCQFEQYPDALRVTLQMDNTQVLKEQGPCGFGN